MREGQLLHTRGPGFLHVVAGDRDRVERRHVRRRVADDVGDDPHARRRRIDVGVADHELFEDVVLDGPAQLVGRHTLLLGRHDVAGQHGQHGAVHRHRDAHLVERDAVEEDLHVFDRVDGHAGLADVTGDAGMVGVVAPVGGEVEGHAHALLAGREVLAVERVRLLGGREAGVLANRPRAVGVHRGPNAAHDTGQCPGSVSTVSNVLEVSRGVDRLDRDAFRRVPGECVGTADLGLFGSKCFPLGELGGWKVVEHHLQPNGIAPIRPKAVSARLGKIRFDVSARRPQGRRGSGNVAVAECLAAEEMWSKFGSC